MEIEQHPQRHTRSNDPRREPQQACVHERRQVARQENQQGRDTQQAHDGQQKPLKERELFQNTPHPSRDHCFVPPLTHVRIDPSAQRAARNPRVHGEELLQACSVHKRDVALAFAEGRQSVFVSPADATDGHGLE